MTLTEEKKPRRPRRSPSEVELDESVKEVGRMPLDDLATFAARLREQFPKATAFLVEELGRKDASG